MNRVARKYPGIGVNTERRTPDTPTMNRRALIAEMASSACLALTGGGALVAMMLQFVYPNESWPAWTAGGLAVAGVAAAMAFASAGARAARSQAEVPLARIGPETRTESRRAA